MQELALLLLQLVGTVSSVAELDAQWPDPGRRTARFDVDAETARLVREAAHEFAPWAPRWTRLVDGEGKP